MRMLFIIVALLAGCSQGDKEFPLFSSYESYLANANKDNIKLTYKEFFDDALMVGLDVNEPFIIEQLLFKDSMSKIISHKERIYENYGCLTVNGESHDGKPISINIEFSNNQPKRLMKMVDILILDSKEDYSNTGVCPKEYIVF